MTPDHSTQATHYSDLARAARVEACARAILKVIDHAEIRKAALAANFALYERAAELIDALGDEPVRVETGDLVLERLPNDTHAWLRPERTVA